MTVGCLEKVSLAELGIKNVWCKVDTGAYSGSIHCTNIRVVKRNNGATRVLKFLPLGRKKQEFETTEFMETYVRSATGHRVKRYVIDTDIEINGKIYKIRTGLSDRRKMKRPVLLGRRFLRENNITVDVRLNQEYDDEGENTR